MELIVIGDSKLKIMLSPKDMAKYALSCDNIDYDNRETKEAFRNILDDAGKRTGFDTSSHKLCLQVFPSRKGGCEIFVSKLDAKDPTLEIREGGIHISVIYRFKGLDPLLSALKILSVRRYNKRSSVYYDDRCYYLVLEDACETSFIGEFAERLKNKNYIYHILEHCERLCINDAVERLSPLY
ncbi:MAG: adaptor protein MecA [Ruminococcaceae bacterium]|nr:adaptor protein MecA [Oscillospiraceae bacterium]